MDGQQQSVNFLRMLSPDAAEKVLARMNPVTAERLRESLSAKPVAIDAGQAAISKFEEMIELLDRAGSPIAKLYEQYQTPEDSLEQELEIQQAAEAATARALATGTPLEQLESLSCFQVANALRPEQPRITAMLLNELSADFAAEVLALLADDQQAQIVIEFSANRPAPPVLMDRIIKATLTRALNMPSEPPDDREQIDRLAEMLRELPKKSRSKMIKALGEKDAPLKDKLMSKLYKFEDLPDLETHIRQKILGQVDTATLVTALFKADEALVESVFSVMSGRARASLEEEMQFQTRVSEDKVEIARAAFVAIMGVVAEGGD